MLADAFWRAYLRHAFQPGRYRLKVAVEGAGSRIGCERAIEFGALDRIELTVDLGMNQFKDAFVAHFQNSLRATRMSRNACRAVNRRDFTVLTGQSRTCAISS